MERLFDDGNQHVGGHGAPDLRLHRVFARAQKTLDAQMLLDPFEERLHLPAALIQRGNGQRRQCRVVGQKYQRLARHGVVVSDASQMFGILAGHVKTVESNRLIADHTRASVSLGRVHTLCVHPAVGAGHKERACLMQPEESTEVQITPIHHVIRPRFDGQDIEHLDAAHLAVADVNEGWGAPRQLRERQHAKQIGAVPLETHINVDVAADTFQFNRDYRFGTMKI